MNSFIKRNFNITCILRLSKAIVALSVGLFCLSAVLNNIVDSGTNYQFVQHILSMDTLAPWFQGADAIGHRAITSPTLHKFFFVCIVTAEFLAGLFATIGGAILLKNFQKGGGSFQKGKIFFIIGTTFGTLVWYFGFCVVGAEWFVMWTSEDWNAQSTAYQFATYILLALVYVSSSEPKVES